MSGGDLLSAQGGGAGLATALTQGSIPFADGSGLLAQDNAKLFWDDASNILGVGTNTPGLFADTQLEILRAGHCVASIITLTAASDAVLILGTLSAGDNAIFTDESDGIKLKFATGDVSTDVARVANTRLTIQQDGKVGIANSSPATALHVTGTIRASAGITLDALTTGSVLFAGPSGAVAQDNANLFWDDTNNSLGVGNSGAASANYRCVIKAIASGSCLEILGNNTASYSGIDFYDSSAAFKGAQGYGNAAVGITYVQSKLFFYSGGPDYVFANGTKVEITLGMTDGSTSIQVADGASAAVSAAGTAKLIYNAGTNKVQISKNGGAYADLI